MLILIQPLSYARVLHPSLSVWEAIDRLDAGAASRQVTGNVLGSWREIETRWKMQVMRERRSRLQADEVARFTKTENEKTGYEVAKKQGSGVGGHGSGNEAPGGEAPAHSYKQI